MCNVFKLLLHLACLAAVKEKASKMHDIMKNMEQKQNFTSVESYKKLGMCKKHYQQLFADHSLLRKKVKNLSLHLGEVVSHQKKQRLLIQQLQWLHKKHGAFTLVY